MITKKIKNKVKNKCGDDLKAYQALIDLLEYEDDAKSKQNQNCKRVVEAYAKEYEKYENRRDNNQKL